jgi:hypothetical protein
MRNNGRAQSGSPVAFVVCKGFEGFLESVRYWVRRYPAFIIAGRKEYVSWDKAALDRVLQAHISGESSTG